MEELYIPDAMRRWPIREVEIAPVVNLSVKPIDTRELVAPSSVGYVPVYDSLEALIAEHGDVPYRVIRRKA